MRTVLGYIGMVVLILLVMTALLFYFGWLRLPLSNLQRQVDTHQQGYVQGVQERMVSEYSDYQAAPDNNHKEAARLQICEDASLLDQADWPAQIASFVSINCH